MYKPFIPKQKKFNPSDTFLWNIEGQCIEAMGTFELSLQVTEDTDTNLLYTYRHMWIEIESGQVSACSGKSDMCGAMQQIENAESFLCHYIVAKFSLSEAPVSALSFLQHNLNPIHMEERNLPE